MRKQTATEDIIHHIKLKFCSLPLLTLRETTGAILYLKKRLGV